MSAEQNHPDGGDIDQPAGHGGSALIIAFVVFLSALAGLIGWLYVTDSSEQGNPSYSNSAMMSAPEVIAPKPATAPITDSDNATQKSEAGEEKETPPTAVAGDDPDAAPAQTGPEEITAPAPETDIAKITATEPDIPAAAAKTEPAGDHEEPVGATEQEKQTAMTPASEPEEATEAPPAKQPARTAPSEKQPAAETNAVVTAEKTEGAPEPSKAPEPGGKEAKTVTPVEKAEPSQPGETVARVQPSMTFSLPPAPNPALLTRGNYGMLPIVGPNGELPWKAYARPFHDPLERPQIALIISDMGMSDAATRSVIQRLPGEVTMSFNPYAKELQNWIEQSRAGGHEVILQLPMEPYGYPKNDPGPHTLLTSLSTQDNLNRLEWLLSRFTGYTGVTSQMGSKFISSDKDIQPVLEVIKKSGLLFVDTRSSSKSVSTRIAKSIDLPVAINNRYLDNSASRNAIDARLGELERIARVTGTAVGIGYPYPVTIERIAQWAESLARKGIVLAPISEVVDKQKLE